MSIGAVAFVVVVSSAPAPPNRKDPTMTTATATLSIPETTARPASAHPVRRAALASGAVAAVATTTVAALARVADVPLAVDGETIPLAGFAQMTLFGAVLGGVLVWALNRRSDHAARRFVQAAVVLTALSCIPSLTLPPDAATKIVLVAAHVLAALVIVPALVRQARS
jgi:hypothetical protein